MKRCIDIVFKEEKNGVANGTWTHDNRNHTSLLKSLL